MLIACHGLGGTLHVSTETFLQERLAAEVGGVLEPGGKDATDILLSDFGDNGHMSATDNEASGGVNSDAASSGATPAAASRQDPPSEESEDGDLPAADPADSCDLCAHARPSSEDCDAIAHQAISPEVSPEVKAAVEAASLRALKKKLEGTSHDEKSALAYVQRVAPALVDDDHLLIFLRHRGFDVDVSVARSTVLCMCLCAFFHLLFCFVARGLHPAVFGAGAATAVRAQGSRALLEPKIQGVWLGKVCFAHDS